MSETPHSLHTKDILLRRGEALRAKIVGLISTAEKVPRKALQGKYEGLYQEFTEHTAEITRFLMEAGSEVQQDNVKKANYTLFSAQFADQQGNLNSLFEELRSKVSSINGRSEHWRTRWFTVISILIALVGLWPIVEPLVFHPKLTLQPLVKHKKMTQSSGEVVDWFDIEFQVHNSGSRGTGNFYYRILLPFDVVVPTDRKRGLGDNSLFLDSKLDHLVIAEEKYMSYAGRKGAVVTPRHSLNLGNLSIKNIPEEFVVLWNFVSSEGDFPAEGKLGSFTFRSRDYPDLTPVFQTK